MDALTCVQSPIIVQSHESEVRPGRIVFPLLPLRIFGNTSADPSRCLADPLVAHEALLDLDVEAFAASWLFASCAVASWLAVTLVQDHGPSRRSYGLQEIVKPFNIPEQNSAGKGENSNFLLLAIPLLHSLESWIRRE